MRYIFVILTIVAIPILASAATLKVPSQYPTIQDAINAASGGDTVKVAPGTYVENINFKGKAITVKSTGGAGMTVIDGDQAGSVVTCQSGEDEKSVLHGFIITNGYASTGGGMGNSKNSSPTVINCTFTGNEAGDGGGMGNTFSSPTVINCTFTGNEASRGGGMYNWANDPTVTNCTFSKNKTSSRGGGMANGNSNLTVTNCTFSENWTLSTYSYGGGMSNDNSSPTVTNCSFSGNVATDNGGGMCNNFNSSPTVSNCIFTGNSAGEGGGMFNWDYNWDCSPTVINCIFTGNSATAGGGGICCDLQSSPAITNTILWNNSASSGPEIWIGGGTSNPSTLTISHSDVKGGQSSVYVDPGCTLNWGSGMIDADPLFVDEASGDFHIYYTSPCKDTGDNTAITEPYDFEGDPRIAYGTVDMGADEFYTHLYWTGDATPGGHVEIQFVGLPGTLPVGLCIGTGVLDPPLSSMWGDWYLMFPIIGPIDMPPIPADGVYVLPGTLPLTPPPPYSIPMQALIGAELTNLSLMEVK